MKAATHLAFAGLVGVVAKGLGADIGVVGGVALGVGALLPDIDTTTSGLGRWVKPLSGIIERRLGHRTLTHSLLGLVLLGLMSSWLLLISSEAWFWLLMGAASHLLVDAHNITGVPLLYPIRLEFVTVTNRALRVAYGSVNEFGYLAGFSLVALCLTPLSVDGFSPWFHRALGAPYGAVEDYLLWRNEYEVFADIDGVNLVSNEDINQRYRVIDALGRETLLLEDADGRAYSAALQGADIQVKKVKVWRGQKITSSSYRLDLNGRLVSDLLYSLPKGALRIHINANLELSEAVKLAPVVGYFERVEAAGTHLSLRAATLGDLAALSRYVINSGSAIIRAEYSPGSEALSDLSVISSTPAFRSHVLRIPDLPSLAGLVVEVGDEVLAGALLARYVADEDLELLKADSEAAALDLLSLEEAFDLAKEEYEVKKLGLEESLVSEQEAVERIRYLVERNAEPKNSLIQAEASLKAVEQALFLLSSSWTSKAVKYEDERRTINLRIQKNKQQANKALQDQWIRSPVTGLISDIRIASVNTKGIHLELMILESEGLDEVELSLNTK